VALKTQDWKMKDQNSRAGKMTGPYTSRFGTMAFRLVLSFFQPSVWSVIFDCRIFRRAALLPLDASCQISHNAMHGPMNSVAKSRRHEALTPQ